jgi:hypothetical protein
MEKTTDCLIYSNCHSIIINYYLRKSDEFNRKYNIINIENYKVLNDKNLIKQIDFNKISLFLYQNIDNAHINSPINIKQYLPEKCKILSFPYSYYTGYFPQYENTITINDIFNLSKNTENLFLLHTKKILNNYSFCFIDKYIYNLIIQHKKLDEIIQICLSNTFIDKDTICNIHNKSINTLSNKENGIDNRDKCNIIVSSHIKNNHDNTRLFIDKHHPSDHIGLYIANSVLDSLNITKVDEHINDCDIYMNKHKLVHYDQYIGIYPSVYKSLNLKFKFNKLNFIKYINNMYLSINSVISHGEEYFRSMTR